MMSKNQIDHELGAKYFKHETLKEKVFKYLNIYPEINCAGIYFKFPSAKPGVLRMYMREHRLINKWGGYQIHEVKAWIRELLYIFRWKIIPKEMLTKSERMAIDHLEMFLRGEKI